ncbi:MAG: radical SAM protein [Planctomycetes bacterium]|nr:radical SAM protein [Planctomycetota bacterium]
MQTIVHPYELVKDVSRSALKGCRVYFINMPLRETAQPNNAPLGLGLLAGKVREYGADPQIVDLNAYRIKDEEAARRGLDGGRHLTQREAEELIEAYFDKFGEPTLVCLSGLITTLRWQERIARYVRMTRPEVFLVAGGGLATEFRSGLFKWMPELDAVAHSEGDDVIIKICMDALAIDRKGFESAKFSGALDPYYKDFVDGRHRFLYDGARPRSLDDMPRPAWDILETDPRGFRIYDMYLRNPVWGGNANNSSAAPFTMEKSANTVSSRGCPFDCHFCYRGAQGERQYGVRSPEDLASEFMWYHKNWGVDFVGLVDDNFMVSPKRIADLPAVLGPLTRETGIRWGTHGRLDEAADIRPDSKSGAVVKNKIHRVELMLEAGCVYIGFGAESAHPVVLKNMGKGGFILTNGTTTIDGFDFPLTMVEGVKECKRVGIHGNCTWIMAYPGETLDQLKTSVAFIRWQEELYTQGLTKGTREYEIAMMSVNKKMFVATAYPGTEMFADPIVRDWLTDNFGVTFDPVTGEPVVDDNLHYYVLELDDATKVLHDKNGRPLNYSAMDEDTFLQAREYVDSDNLYNILDM